MKKDTRKQRFESLYKNEADAIFRYCLFRVSDREVALDLTQDAFARFWDTLSNGKNIQNDRAFIFMIARNLIIDFYRKKKAVSLDNILEENEDQMFMASSLMQEIDISAEGRFVLEKINDLESGQKQIIYLRFVEDLKPQEIAEILGVTPNVVSVRVIRALEKLRGLLGFEK